VNDQQLDQIAAEMLAAKDASQLVEWPSARYAGFDLGAAYSVGERMTALRRARGEQPVGRKIGFTNRGIWAEYKVDSPMWAHVYDSSLVQAEQGETNLSLAGTLAPRLEPEIVLGLRQAPSGPDDDESALLDSVGWLALGFEIVDCHYAGWNLTIPDAVADFALHYRLVVGRPLPVDHSRAARIVEALRETGVELRRADSTIATGKGANALGSPLLALGYLGAVLRRQPAALQLGAGEVITTGTLTPAMPITVGETWSVRVDALDLAPLTVHFRA
jgi:2-oxo-3-hexenedioate decarboxylase